MHTVLKAKEILSAALNLPEVKIDQNTAIGKTPEWDSLAHMRLILAVEELVGRELGMEEVIGIESLSDVENTLKRHISFPS
jgi:acyl carrier protein